MSDDAPLVSLDDVSVTYEDRDGGLLDFSDPDRIHAVDGVSLDLADRDVFVLVGESGSGKTTLGKTMIGLQRPTEGSVAYRGQDVWDAKDGRGRIDIPHDEIRHALQIVHQDPVAALNPNKTVRHSLHKPLRVKYPDLEIEDREARIRSMLKRVGLNPADDYATRYPHQLSGGEAQRVVLIRALLMNPDLILADEAISALDVSLRIDMMDLMHDLRTEFDTAFVLISHNLANARYFAKKANGKIGVMYLGELVEVGTPDEVINDPQHPYTKSLRWGEFGLESLGFDSSSPPIRTFDVQDPADPPAGCKFHTRCPEAREACTGESPPLRTPADAESDRTVACFRYHGSDHEYWSSPELAEETDDAAGTADD